MTKYARDEFDRVPETPTRQGVHRAAAESRRRSLGPILAVGAVALVIGLVAFLFLPKLGFNSAGSSAAVTAEQPATPAASAAPSASSPTPAGESQASGSPSAVPSASAPSSVPSTTASPEGNAAVDKTQPVAVYNATGTAGLASRVGATVTSDGWKLGPVGNWGGARQTSSVIFYSGPDQEANAQALAVLLGIPTVVDSTELNMPLVVVLGPGFR